MVTFTEYGWASQGQAHVSWFSHFQTRDLGRSVIFAQPPFIFLQSGLLRTGNTVRAVNSYHGVGLASASANRQVGNTLGFAGNSVCPNHPSLPLQHEHSHTCGNQRGAYMHPRTLKLELHL